MSGGPHHASERCVECGVCAVATAGEAHQPLAATVKLLWRTLMPPLTFFVIGALVGELWFRPGTAGVPGELITVVFAGLGLFGGFLFVPGKVKS